MNINVLAINIGNSRLALGVFMAGELQSSVRIPHEERQRWPAAIADAVRLEKGEEMEWLIEDRNNFVLKRVKQAKTNLPKKEKDN